MDRLCYCERPLSEHDGPCIGLAVDVWEACGYEVQEHDITYGATSSRVALFVPRGILWDYKLFPNIATRPDLSHDLVAELIWQRVDVDDDNVRLPYIWALERVCAKYGLRPDFAPAWAKCVSFLMAREA